MLVHTSCKIIQNLIKIYFKKFKYRILNININIYIHFTSARFPNTNILGFTPSHISRESMMVFDNNDQHSYTKLLHEFGNFGRFVKEFRRRRREKSRWISHSLLGSRTGDLVHRYTRFNHSTTSQYEYCYKLILN